MTLTEKFNEIAELANVAPIPEVFGLSGREEILANKEAEASDRCDHACTSMCRHNGCNCDCGEWHDDGEAQSDNLKLVESIKPTQDDEMDMSGACGTNDR